MIATIHKSELHGEITICPSKSYEQRAWAIASLPNSEISISNCGKSADAVASHRIAQKLLSFDPNDKTFDCGESALCARMYPPIIALRTDSFILYGHRTLQKRNIRHDLEFFEKNLGWNISSKGLPINISNAHITPGNYTIDGSHTSQVITGMIFALSTLPANSTITVEKPSSTGYIFLTIEIARQAGADITTEQKSNALEISIQGNTHYKASFNVEGDWSNAAFLIVAGLTNGEIGISGLNQLSQQPDRAIMDVLDICNANYECNPNYHKLIFFSDMAVVPQPDFRQKVKKRQFPIRCNRYSRPYSATLRTCLKCRRRMQDLWSEQAYRQGKQSPRSNSFRTWQTRCQHKNRRKLHNNPTAEKYYPYPARLTQRPPHCNDAGNIRTFIRRNKNRRL